MVKLFLVKSWRRVHDLTESQEPAKSILRPKKVAWKQPIEMSKAIRDIQIRGRNVYDALKRLEDNQD